MPKKLNFLLPYIILAFLPILFFWQGLFGQQVMVVGDFTGSDLLDLHLPFKYALHESYSQGSFPLWTRYIANGFPLAAEGQSGPFYPPNIILAFIPPYLALNLSIVLVFIVAGWGAYVYSRQLGLLKVAAFWVALAFMFSSFFIARVKHLNMIVVAAYLPWVLWCARKSIVHISEQMELRSAAVVYKWFIVLGVIWALQLLAGHPHMTYLTMLMVLWHYAGESFYLLLHLGKKALIPLKRIFFGLLLASLVAVTLAAIQLLPTAELTVQTSRVHLTFEKAVGNPMRGKFLWTFLYPYLFGNPAEGTYKVDILREGIWWENTLYIGILPFLLAVYAIIRLLLPKVRGFKRTGDWITVGFTWLKQLSFSKYYLVILISGALVFLSLSFGGYSLLYLLAFYVVPGMSLFRFPTRFNEYFLLVMCLLSGVGLTQLMDILRQRAGRFSDILVGVLFIVAGLNSYWFLHSYITYVPVDRYLTVPESVKDVSGDELSRIYPLTQYEINPYYISGWRKGREAIVSELKALPGNNPIVHKVDSFTDRGWFEGGLVPQERYNLEYHLLSNDSLKVEEWERIFSAWNVKYFLTYRNLPQYRLVTEYAADPFFKTKLKLYENLSVLPRAFITSSVVSSPNYKAMISAMKSQDWDPRHQVYTPKPTDEYSSSGAVEAYAPVQISEYSNQKVVMTTESNSDGVLVFSDSFYPGWQARVDGQTTRIFPVNLIQRAIQLPHGKHTVSWTYSPVSFTFGLAITGISIILIAGWLAYEKLFK